jgi:hypothetical protein
MMETDGISICMHYVQHKPGSWTETPFQSFKTDEDEDAALSVWIPR